MSYHSGSFWTEENVATTKQLWMDGYSFTRISEHFGNAVSRSAVCGKLRRFGMLGVQRGTSKPLVEREKPAPPKPKPAPGIDPSVEPKPLGVPLLAAGYGECRWPSWDMQGNPNFLCCGHATQLESSYCSFHFAKSCGTGTYSERAARKAPADFSVRAVE